MDRMKCPLNIGSLNIQGHEYKPDKEGYITPVSAAHIEDLERHGVRVFLVEDTRPDVIISVGGEAVDIAAMLSEIAALQSANAALVEVNSGLVADLETSRAENQALRDQLSEGAEEPGEGTSEEQEEAEGDEDTSGLSWDRPDADSSRDELVDWLRAREVAISPATSKDAAWTAVEETLAAHAAATA